MRRYSNVLAVLASVVLIVLVMACSNDSSDQPDTWTKIESLAGLNGTWEGTYQDEEGTKTITIEYPVGNGYSMTVKTDMTAMIDAGAKTSGKTADEIWQEEKDLNKGSGGTYSSGRPYTVTETMPDAEESLKQEIKDGKTVLYVNQSKNKIKMEMYATDSSGNKTKVDEIILVKK